MDEAWGLKSLLDASDDVAVFVVSEREDKIIYCNYLVSLKTGLHSGSPFSGIWEECREHMAACGDGRTYRFFAAYTPFGSDKNVTITKTVWPPAGKAYTFMVSSHVENKEEQEREIILGALGRSYLSVRVLELEGEEKTVRTVFYHSVKTGWIFKPMSFFEWRSGLFENYIYDADVEKVAKCLDTANILRAVKEDSDGITIQYRRKENDEYRWTQMHIAYLKTDETDRIVCTEKDIHGELIVNRENMEKELIMNSLANIYRSVYLLDLNTGEYTTVKPDELLFGIPGEGVYEEMLSIVSELIPDAGQKKDLAEYFSLEAIKKAFEGDVENIGREYNSTISESVSWMGISVFRTPSKKGMENKCVVTFMDITEHKRVEAEKNESKITFDVLSSRYVALFFIHEADYSYHAMLLPNRYKYLPKQYSNVLDGFNHYISAYVLDDYKEGMRNYINLQSFKTADEKQIAKQEYIFKNVDNEWIRLSLTRVPGEEGEPGEYIMAFEDYNDVMETYASSSIYSRMLLADYEHMYEYDLKNGKFYELVYDGSKLVRDYQSDENDYSLAKSVNDTIHPDDLSYFMAACSNDAVEQFMTEGKTVSHLMVRRKTEDGYHQFIYGFHYFEEYGKKTVLVMERDSDRELV